MKILQINSVCGVGSTGRIVTDIHKMLTEQGYESYIAFGRNQARYCDRAIRIGTTFDNYTHVFKTRLFDRHGFGSRRVTIEFIKKVKELNPDIIHLHNLHGYYINIDILFHYLKGFNKPVVWTLHDCWAFTGHCSYFDYVGCNKWIECCHNCPLKREYPSTIIFDSSTFNYNMKKELFTSIKNMTIVTPSNWLASLVKKSFLLNYPIKVINNGIDLEIFKPIKSSLREKFDLKYKFIILGVANVWNERKGFQYFLELSKKINNNDIIILVGLTEKQIRRLPNNIIGITRTNNLKELAELYSLADVFVNPTLEDNFPTTNLEALACGTPVITYNTGGSPESVTKDCGFVVNRGDLNALLNRIEFIKKIGKSSYTDKAISRAKELYDKNINFISYLNLYNMIYEKSFSI